VSASALTTLIERRAFAATRRFDELATFHVPFEKLADRPKAVERRLERVLDRGGRAAVAAASGGGKSSVLAALLHPPPELGKPTYAPIRLGVGGVSDVETLADPRALALRAIGDLAAAYLEPDDARSLRQRGALTVNVQGRTEAVRRQLGGRLGQLSKEIRQASESYDFDRSQGEVLAALAAGVAALRDRGLAPLLLLEDADGLLGLRRVASVDGAVLVEEFFARGLSGVVTELDVPVLIAIQPEYRQTPAFDKFRRNLLSDVVELPTPKAFTEHGVRLLVSQAMRNAGLTASPEAVFDPRAMGTLVAVRYAMETVRQLISVCDYAVSSAEAAGADFVTESHVAYGISQAGLG